MSHSLRDDVEVEKVVRASTRDRVAHDAATLRPRSRCPFLASLCPPAYGTGGPAFHGPPFAPPPGS